MAPSGRGLCGFRHALFITPCDTHGIRWKTTVLSTFVKPFFRLWVKFSKGLQGRPLVRPHKTLEVLMSNWGPFGKYNHFQQGVYQAWPGKAHRTPYKALKGHNLFVSSSKGAWRILQSSDSSLSCFVVLTALASCFAALLPWLPCNLDDLRVPIRAPLAIGVFGKWGPPPRLRARPTTLRTPMPKPPGTPRSAGHKKNIEKSTS